jgi:deazaflavin-dependent oxidoreductase (nitroreductase family)
MKFIGRLIFSLMNFLYRSTGGRIGGKMNGGDVLLLTTTGRKSGKQRTVPLIYIMDGSAYVITASAGGAKNPGWFFNVRSNPQAVIQVKDKRMSVLGEVAGPDKKPELWARLVEAMPFYANYQKRTSREFPMMILHPVEASV